MRTILPLTMNSKTNHDRLVERIDCDLVIGIDPQRGSLEAAMHYALSVKGKRLRPLLFLTLLEAHGIAAERYMDIACAMEIIHTYSLIHDDLPAMDNDDMRRGFPTVHKKFNEAIALLAGDTLLTFAFEKIASANLPPRLAIAIMRTITVAIGKDGMAGGQALDLEFQGVIATIHEIHQKKTAELIKGALLAAALIVPLTAQKRVLLAQAGLAIGHAFQMADDLLDIVGDEHEVGKKLHKDQGNQSPNIVLFKGIDAVKAQIDARYTEAMAIFHQLGISDAPFLALIEQMAYRSK